MSAIVPPVTAGRCPPWLPFPSAARSPAESVPLEFAGGGEGPHHELHRGQQLAGAWMAGGEVHRGERAVVNAKGEAVAVKDVENAEDVRGAAHEAVAHPSGSMLKSRCHDLRTREH